MNVTTVEAMADAIAEHIRHLRTLRDSCPWGAGADYQEAERSITRSLQARGLEFAIPLEIKEETSAS